MKVKYILLTCLFLTSLTSCLKYGINLFIGEEYNVYDENFISLSEQETKEKYNYSFSNKEFYMKDFYNRVENEAVDLKSKKSIITLLRKSKKVFLNIGNYEFLRFVNFNDYKFEYNEKVVSTNREMFEYYLMNILETINDYTNDVVVINTFPYLKLNNTLSEQYVKILDDYRHIVNEVCAYLNIKKIDIKLSEDHILGHTLLNRQGALKIIEQIKYAD